MEMPDALQDLKDVIVEFLLACPSHQCRKSIFWSSIGKYNSQYQNVSLKQYGISKLDRLFDMFNDVLRVTKNTVGLRESVVKNFDRPHQPSGSRSTSKSQQKKKKSNVAGDAVIVISESDGSDSQESFSHPGKDIRQQSSNVAETSHDTLQESLMFWGSGVAGFASETPRQSSDLIPPASSNLTGFIPFSSDTATRRNIGDQAKPPHDRYGNSSTDTPSNLPSSLKGNQTFPPVGFVPLPKTGLSAPEPQCDLNQPQSGGDGPRQALFQTQSQLNPLGSSINPFLATRRNIGDQAKPPHDRYGNSSTDTPSNLPSSLKGNQTFPPVGFVPLPKTGLSAPEPQCDLNQPQSGGDGPRQAPFQTQPQLNPLGSSINPFLAQWFTGIPGNVPQSSLSSALMGDSPLGQVGAFASPALLASPSTAAASLTATEWPKPKPRTGPPPGTKITEPPKEMTVKSVTLQRGARLTVDQVDYEINDCIEILSNLNEHVSLERMEELLLRKFKVSNFRALNLPQRYFTQIDAANEHSRLLGKVNAYIQNFARSRSFCTLYELGECCREFHKHKEEFEKLRLGPLQKMPVVNDLFKFPMDEYIPEITSIDLLEHLNNFLDRNNKWTTRVQLEEFLRYLEKVYSVENSFSLGIRLRSLPLAIQTLKKSKRDAAHTRRKVNEEMMALLHQDLKAAFSKYRESLLQATDSTGSYELRRHYSNLSPANAVNEILQKYTLLAETMAADVTPSKVRKIERFLRIFESFVKHLFDDSFPQLLFHLAVSMSNNDVEQTAMDFLEQKRQQSQMKVQQEASRQARQPPSKNTLTDRISTYLNKCLENGVLQLSHLKKIEEKVVEDFNFSSFHEFGHSSFLEFLLSDKKMRQTLEEHGGTILGSSSTTHDGSSSIIAGQKDLIEFICQCRDGGSVQNEQLALAMCEQYHVAEVKCLGHGNISHLCQAAGRSGRHVAKLTNCVFEAAICGKACRPTRSSGNVGLRGSQSRESAIACLTACPLLEDMSEWSHWPLLFQPQHGPLRDFINKFGGVQFHSIDGGKRTATSDFLALEVVPGKFLKLSAQSSQEDFISALEAEDPLLIAGHLVSLIVSNKGIESSPLALLSTHVKAKLNALHARMSTPGGPPHLGSLDMVDPAVDLITVILLRLPLRICIAIANQLLLEPLSQVVGSAKSKVCIAHACRSPAQCQKLEQLGCLLGVQEWMSFMNSRMAFPEHLIQENVDDDDLLDQPPEENEPDEEEEFSSVEDDSDEEDEEAEIEQILWQPVLSREHVEDDSTEIPEVREEEECDSTDENESSESTDEEDEGADQEAKESAETGNSDKESGSESNRERSMSFVENDIEVTEQKENGEDIIAEVERELTKEEKCQRVVTIIREKEFGVGIQLTNEIQDLMQKQQERQGRSLERLSKELYSKDTHFVLELIQNADDNHYDTDVTPAIKFVISSTGVIVFNNEKGFEENNIRALCDVGKSTKTKHNLGYIGQKGIGFKSVFRVTGRPEVHSNGYHIYFDVNSGPMGYIMPHWSDTWEATPSWQTQISLPWTEEIVNQITTHAARFNDIQPSLLLFLHRLKEITIDNQVEGNELHMERLDLAKGMVEISHSHGKDRWLVVRKLLDASSISLQAKSGVEVASTEIALAFPIYTKEAMLNVRTKLNHLPVFAFLPLRSYGFKFILQGDFDVPSSREDVDRDSSWNQWLRSEVPSLFLDALDSFQALPNMSPMEALMTYLQFVPMDGEVMDFFKPVTHHILSQLRAKEILPVLGASGDMQWKMPSKTIISRDSLVREIISPELLKHHLALHFLHDDVASVLDEAQIQALGIEKISTEHLLLIGQSVTQNWDGQGNTDQVIDIAKWMACVYRSLDDFRDNTDQIQKLRSLKIIPLSSGSLVSVEDSTVFLLKEEKQDIEKAPTKGKAARTVRDPFQELKSDLNLVHGSLLATSDMEINSQVAKLLFKIGIKEVTPHDLIHSHILPILEFGQWKGKKNKVVVSYLVYIKSELDKRPDILQLEQLRRFAPILTNDGIKIPAQENVHFSTDYGNQIDLEKNFHVLKWTLVDRQYLPPSPTPLDRQTWHTFLSSLGVNDFLCVRKEEVHLEVHELPSSAWSAYEGLWPTSMDGYVLHDFSCQEFYKLATLSNASHDVLQNLYICLDKMWDSVYKDYRYTQLKSCGGDVLKDTVETSFFIQLKTLSWAPARWVSMEKDVDIEKPIISQKSGCRPPHHLYTQHEETMALLGDTVEYLDIKVASSNNSSFTQSIQVKHQVKKETLKGALISWGQRDAKKPKTPQVFYTSLQHILKVYEYLSNELSRKESQDLFHQHAVFFIPLCSGNLHETVGAHMMRREEICWQDDTGLFKKHIKSLQLYQSPLASLRFMDLFYHGYEEIFQQARLKKTPDILDCSELLKHLASVMSLQDSGTLKDALLLMSRIGADMRVRDEVEAGIPTNEAIVAKANVEKVKGLLTPCAIFPTKGGKWVSLQDRPMISDSPELEQLFANKQGVHFLQVELPISKQRPTRSRRPCSRHTEDLREEIDPDLVKLCLSLFEGIKLLSDSITTQIITSGFQPCYMGQMYMFRVVPLLQKFLFFLFPDVYDKVKTQKAATLQELQFIQVLELKVKYELIDQPDIYEFREDKCFVEDKMFYFHDKYIDEQAEIHREVAKFFSHGDEECCRELRSFLFQAVAILEGKSNEAMGDFLSRQRQPIYDLPEEEVLWEVPAPIAPQPPEPKSSMDVGTPDEMVYGRALSVPVSEKDTAEEKEDGSDSNVMKCWPPRSHVDIPPAQKAKSDKPESRPVPLENQDYVKLSRKLPSNIQFESESEPQTEDGDENKKTKPTVIKNTGDQADLHEVLREKDPHVGRKKDTRPETARQNSQSSAGSQGDAKLRQYVITVPEKEDNGAQTGSQETGEKRKRKWKQGSESESENDMAAKRFSGGEIPPSQDQEKMDVAVAGDAEKGSTSESVKDSDSNSGRVMFVDADGETKESGQMDVTSSLDVSQNSNRSEDHLSVAKKNKFLRLSIPIWNEQMEDMKSTEIASGADLVSLIGSQKLLPEDSQITEIGKWGERVVYHYLKKQMQDNKSILDVIWANQDEETGLPYDLEIVFKTDDGSDDKQYSVFVDVKATVTEDKAVFEISARQVEFAMQQKERYQIFRVYNAGKDNMRLVRIDNIADRLLTKSVKLFLMI